MKRFTKVLSSQELTARKGEVETLERELLQLRDEVAQMKDCRAFPDSTSCNQIDKIVYPCLSMFTSFVFFHAPEKYLQTGLEFIHRVELKSIIKFSIISNSLILSLFVLALLLYFFLKGIVSPKFV